MSTLTGLLPGMQSSVDTALADWSSQPTQTAAAGADTLLKFGSDGTVAFNHLEIQNNSSVAFNYAIDQDSTATHAKVYVVPGGSNVHIFVDRHGNVLHCSSASQITFGGTSGVTIEAFA